MNEQTDVKLQASLQFNSEQGTHFVRCQTLSTQRCRRELYHSCSIERW
jgi:hypothetical protein